MLGPSCPLCVAAECGEPSSDNLYFALSASLVISIGPSIYAMLFTKAK